MKKARAVFWDMDGTLIDTEDLHYEVICDWCAEHGYELTLEGNDELIAKTMQEKWRILEPRVEGGSEELFRKECEEWYIERVSAESGLERSNRIVRRLAEMGVPQACVSNGEYAVTKANCDILGLTQYFSFLITGKDCDQGKPAPDPYLMAAEKMGFAPGECVAVEDSPVGMAAARAAGVILCGWPHDFEAEVDVDYRLRTGEEFPWELFEG